VTRFCTSTFHDHDNQQDLPMPTTSSTAAAAIDFRLATKGRNQPLDGLLEQAKVSVGLAKLHAATLGVASWTALRTTAMESEIASLQGDVVAGIDRANVARHATQQQHAAIDAAKEFIRKLRAATPMVLRDTKIEGIPHDAFHAGGGLGRSVPTIAGYLLGVKGPLLKLDADFAPYFAGKSPSTLLVDVGHALDTADVTQETGIKSLPEATLTVYETKGRLLENIEDLNRIAKIAFEGDARARALFNKDILLRARKAAKGTPSDAAAGDAKTATTSPTPASPSGSESAATTSNAASPAPPTAKNGKAATLEPAHA
jgi:hypothetical protein